jgi:repressor LexA
MVQYLRANTYQPSIREIGRRFGIKSTKTVSEHLQALADKGFLERDSSRSRGVRILGVDLSTDTVRVPCYGGVPSDASNASGTREVPQVAVDRQLGGEEGSFFVRASAGDLAVLGVEEGDLVLVSPASAASVSDGTVVLAHVGNGEVFHRVRRNGRSLVLESLSDAGDHVAVDDPERLTLLGRVAGFYRRMDQAALPALTRH